VINKRAHDASSLIRVAWLLALDACFLTGDAWLMLVNALFARLALPSGQHGCCSSTCAGSFASCCQLGIGPNA
jgi:hypothetical protein